VTAVAVVDYLSLDGEAHLVGQDGDDEVRAHDPNGRPRSDAKLRTLHPDQRRRAVKISASVMTSDPYVDGGHVLERAA
jgi:hypothetical protein